MYLEENLYREKIKLLFIGHITKFFLHLNVSIKISIKYRILLRYRNHTDKACSSGDQSDRNLKLKNSIL